VAKNLAVIEEESRGKAPWPSLDFHMMEFGRIGFSLISQNAMPVRFSMIESLAISSIETVFVTVPHANNTSVYFNSIKTFVATVITVW